MCDVRGGWCSMLVAGVSSERAYPCKRRRSCRGSTRQLYIVVPARQGLPALVCGTKSAHESFPLRCPPPCCVCQRILECLLAPPDDVAVRFAWVWRSLLHIRVYTHPELFLHASESRACQARVHTDHPSRPVDWPRGRSSAFRSRRVPGANQATAPALASQLISGRHTTFCWRSASIVCSKRLSSCMACWLATDIGRFATPPGGGGGGIAASCRKR